MNDFLDNTPLRHFIPGVLLASLLLLAYMVLREFLLSLTWAFILAYVTWPLYRWLRHRLKDKGTLKCRADDIDDYYYYISNCLLAC